jgi:hypothetical protein
MEVKVSQAIIDKIREMLDLNEVDFDETERKEKIETKVNEIIDGFIEGIASFYR